METQEYSSEYERQVALAQKAQANNFNANAYATASMNDVGRQNLVEVQLDFSQDLIDIERLLRGDVLFVDEENQTEKWIKNPNKENINFNDKGVNDIIKNLRVIINKGKALSFYNPDEINERVWQHKDNLRMLVYNNYEEYGMDNDYKKNNYSMIITSINSLIDDVYRRAMNGQTHKGVTEQRLVTQNETLNPQGTISNPQLQKEKKWYNPYSWFR